MNKFIFIIITFISLSVYSQNDTISYNKSKGLYKDQQYLKAIESFNDHLVFEKDSSIIANCYHYIGISYYMLGDHSKALEYILNNLKINLSLNNKCNISNAYNNLGAIYDTQENYKDALFYYNKSLIIAEESQDSISIAGSLNNISSIKINLELYDEAYIDLIKALDINLRYKQANAIILNYTNIGNSFNGLKNIKKSLYYHKLALSLAKERNDYQNMSMSYINVGEDYFKIKKYSKAISCFNNALLISDSLNLLYYSQVSCFNLSNVYTNLKNDKLSLYYYKKYISFKDSIFSKENIKNISYLNVKYKSKEKENTILKLSNLDNIQKKEIEKKTMTNKLLILLALVFSITGIFIIILFKKNRKNLKSNIFISNVLKERNKNITDSINYAKNIQNNILSTIYNFNNNIKKSFVLFKPKDIVSGDFYWDLNLGDVQYFAAADCTGHGVPGAMLSIIGHTALNKSIKEDNLRCTSSILSNINNILSDTFKNNKSINDGMDISLCKLDRKNKILKCSSANNPIYIIRDSNKKKLNYKEITFNNKTLYKIEADRNSIGYNKEYRYTEHTINLEDGDSIYIFTDGFADQFGGHKGKKYKYGQFQMFLTSICDLPEDEQLVEIEKEFKTWKRDIEQVDDILVIGVNI